jgi:hypothetical protein
VSSSPSGDPISSDFRDVGLRPHTPDNDSPSGDFDSRARNALALGVFSLLFGVLTGAPAIWLGRKALVHINDAGGALRGGWAAWTGIVLGCVGVAITLAWLVYLL